MPNLLKERKQQEEEAHPELQKKVTIEEGNKTTEVRWYKPEEKKIWLIGLIILLFLAGHLYFAMRGYPTLLNFKGYLFGALLIALYLGWAWTSGQSRLVKFFGIIIIVLFLLSLILDGIKILEKKFGPEVSVQTVNDKWSPWIKPEKMGRKTLNIDRAVPYQVMSADGEISHIPYTDGKTMYPIQGNLDSLKIRLPNHKYAVMTVIAYDK